MRFLIALVVVAACTQPRSARCKQVCSREAACVERTTTLPSFDEKECVAACAVLEADGSNNLAVVEQHARCVERNKSTCQAMLACP